MVEQIFDPQLFNYAWESVIASDDYVVGTYYIKDVKEDSDFIDHLSQVKRLVLEGSTSSWVQVEEDTPELREKLTSKLIGYYEVPAPAGTKKAVIQIAFPIGHWDVEVNIPMLLLSIAGNYTAFPTNIRLVDLYIPKKVAEQFQGPKFGISGVRELLGVEERPLHLHIIKPKMGMTPKETADQVYETGSGGADLCKDDEMLSELSYCTMEDRLKAVAETIDRLEQEQGHKMLYMLSITDEVDKVQEKARWAVDNGASGLLLAYSAGLSTLRVLAEDPAIDVPILLHVSHMLAMLPHINFPVLSKLCRLCGADMMLSPSIWSSIPVASPEESYRNAQIMQAPFYHIKRTWPMPAAGMHPGLAEVLLQEYGPDIIIPAGGGTLGHPMGYTAGAMAWQQAFEAAMAGVPLAEAAEQEGYEALRAALEKWGLRKRPVTAWGYYGEEFNPKFADKNI